MDTTPSFHNEFNDGVRTVIQAQTVNTAREPELNKPFELGYRPRVWTDRTETIEFLVPHLREPDPRPVHIIGPPGVGKTALVAVVASIIKESYPDGVVHIELDASGADDAMRSVLDRLGAGRLPEEEGELEKRYVSALAGKRIVIVLDGASLKSDIERFWPRSESAAYIVLSEKRLRWHEALRIELPPLDVENATALLERAMPLGEEVIERLVESFEGCPGLLLDAGGIVSAGAVGIEELVELAGDGRERRLLLRALDSLGDGALRVYQALGLLPHPVVEQSLLDAIDAASEDDRPSEDLKRVRLLVKVGNDRWRLMAGPDGASRGGSHDR
ncbi:NB-ARC domain-containing protein [Glycomyces salinus]|uniref:NB-ARC domain-containing protein n=1 Tax=Glycomyces salinus TaxID=980294 RepID=UPI0018EB730F|nr:ATP-binding protein [Glycomyces salinus]